MAMVSVIIPAYNSGKYLGTAITSVLEQTFTDYEIIVIDDGSTDETSEVAYHYQQHIRYFKYINGGPAAARNRGLRYASGKYIAFLDADDLFLQNKLALQVKYLETHPHVDLVYSDGFRSKTDSNGKEQLLPLSKTGELENRIEKSDEYVFNLMIHNLFPINSSLVKKDVVDHVGGFDETLTACEDWDLWFRISEIAHIEYFDGFVSKYQVIPNSNSTDHKRNACEAEKVMSKIISSPTFLDAPSNIRGLFYYRKGINLLFLEEIEKAIFCFYQSILAQKKTNYSYLALVLTKIFGNRAIFFYLAKRKFFGKNGVREM